MQINDADIDRSEKLLLPPGCTFNEERCAFIKCMESLDVISCPGSGKTTALLAKLLILAAHMPFSDGRGICVLTHTNVAIDEIKRRAGSAADALFAHPNYFGTIQGFVDRYLAIPAYRNIYKHQVQGIDNDLFYDTIGKYYQSAVDIQPWLNPRGGAEALGKYWLKISDLTVGCDLDHDISKLRRGTPTYCKIERIRQQILQHGILSFNDAYSLGLHYLSHYPSVIDSIRHRFKYVFIDEMQDTEDHQLRVINQIFTDSNTVILQRLGDPNQAIYQSEMNQKRLWSPKDSSLTFSDSLRYGESIAKVLKTVRVNRTLALGYNPERKSLPPHILLFDTGNESAVLPEFGTLIRAFGLHEIASPRFCAVGWVGQDKRDKNNLCIPDYYPEYQKPIKNNSINYNTFLSYVQAIDLSMREDTYNVHVAINIVLAGIVHAIRIANQKNPGTNRAFTIATLMSYLKDADESLYINLRLSLAVWVLALRQREMSVQQIRNLISEFILKHFITKESTAIREFLNSNDVVVMSSEQNCSNTFISAAGDVIEVGTVHSVKGQTYTATLYLETMFKGRLDSERLLPFCFGNYNEVDSTKPHHCVNLNIAHVAFSRPTHLLGFACSKAIVAEHENELNSAGWVIRKI